ncbi:MAG: DUF1761 domain-containing protein [Pseudomonadota bacterium]
MGYLAVILAAVAAFAFGAGWYGLLAEPWKKASGVPLGEDGNPINAKSPVPYVTSFICIILVAGMMRHSFSTADITTLDKGIISGAGIGLFFITPWLGLTNGYNARPLKLTAIDGGYATIGCAIMGGILTVL